MFRSLICVLLVAVAPVSLPAADTGAMLYGKGVVLRNGTEIPGSSAIFPGDMIETRAGSTANLNSMGSSVVILPGSLLEFQGEAISVEHGSVSISTSRGVSVRVGCMTIVPVSTVLTQFEVTDVNGSVEIAARKSDVKLQVAAKSALQKEAVHDGGVLHEGEQATRQSDGCEGAERKKGAGATPAGSGNIFSSEYVKYGAIAGAGGLALWFALEKGNPPSPWKP